MEPPFAWPPSPDTADDLVIVYVRGKPVTMTAMYKWERVRRRWYIRRAVRAVLGLAFYIGLAVYLIMRSL